MKNARSLHSATLLPNGKVLVVGGDNSKTTELYDPAAGSWTLTGPLNISRMNSGGKFTATLLPNGKVLVAGGWNGSELSSAELYDPATGTWAFTAPMVNPRGAHSATLLSNGKVLVAGGYVTGIGSISSAELYDPASGTWTPTGAMTTGRFFQYQGGILLPNGKVLVPGGYQTQAGYLSSSELYDPVTGTWTATSPLSIATQGHTATLLPNGKVLDAGGWGESIVRSAEVFDPADGTWTPTGSLVRGRALHTATLLANGMVLATGGGGSEPPHSGAELYDFAAGTWTTTAAMAIGREWHTATLLLNGNVLVAGGTGPTSGPTSAAEIYQAGSSPAVPSIIMLHSGHDIMSFSWTGIGTLEQSGSLDPAEWQRAPMQDNPHIVGITGPRKFFRLRYDQ